MASCCAAAFFAQRMTHALPEPGIPPAAKLLMHGLPRRKIGGQLTPLTARLHHIKQRIDDAPQLMLARSATGVTLAMLQSQQRL